MGLIEDLKSLEELHANGRLTDDEFSAAKAAALAASRSSSATAAPAVAPAPTSVATSASQKKGLKTGKILALVAVVALAWIFIQQNSGNKSASTLLKEAVTMPVDLTNETFGIPAASWKAIGIQTPYDGSLTISVQVARGNPMEMFLTDSAGLDQLKSTRHGTYIGGFYSVKGTSFQHSERIQKGVYYFVVWDRSLGILSASSSDIALKARIDP